MRRIGIAPHVQSSLAAQTHRQDRLSCGHYKSFMSAKSRIFARMSPDLLENLKAYSVGR
jgi:hypothetical protein